jgi:WD40 repeat protein
MTDESEFVLELDDLLAEPASSENVQDAAHQDAGKQLVDARQRWFAVVKDCVRRDAQAELAALAASQTAGHRLLDVYEWINASIAPALGAPFIAEEGHTAHAARALASLGLSLVVTTEAAAHHLRVFRRWADRSHLALRGQPVGTMPALHTQHTDRIRHLVEQGEVDLLSLVWLMELDGGLPRQGRRVGTRVLLSLGSEGQLAELSLLRLRGLPDGLIPDPASMSLTSADSRYLQSLRTAWRAAGWQPSGVLLWSLADQDGPVRRVVDESLGAAFAVLLDEQRRLRGRLRALVVVRRLQPMTAITGRLDPTDPALLSSVSGYEVKLKAAPKGSQVVLPSVDESTAKREEPEDRDLELVPVRTWKRAARVAQNIQRRRQVVIGVFCLMVMVAAGGFGLWLRSNAQIGTDQRQARAHQLASLALANAGSDIALAQLDAVAAYRLDPDPQTTSALLKAASGSPHLVRELPVGFRTTVLTGSAAGHMVAIGTSDGHLVRWDVDHGTMTQVRTGAAPITEIATDADGGRIVATDGTELFIWNGDSASRPIAERITVSGSGSNGKDIAISPSGATIVALDQPADGAPRLIVMAGDTGRVLNTSTAQATGPIGLPNDQMLNIQDLAQQSWVQESVPSLQVIGQGPPGILGLPGDGFGCCGYSADAGYLAWAKFDTVNVFADNPDPGTFYAVGAHFSASVPIEKPDQFAVSGDGMAVAVAGAGQLFVSPVTANSPVAAQQLTGTGAIDAVTFVGGDQQLVSADDTSLTYWDLQQTSQVLAAGPLITAPFAPQAGGRPQVAISPDGRHIAMYGPDHGDLILVDPSGSTTLQVPTGLKLPIWDPRNNEWLLLGDGAVRVAGQSLTPVWRQPNPGWPFAAQVSSDGLRVAEVNDDGAIQLRDLSDGTVLKSIPGDPRSLGGAISADGTTAATIQGNGDVVVTNVPTGHQDSRLTGYRAQEVAFGDNQLLVVGTENSLQVRSMDGTQLLRTIPPDTSGDPYVTGIPGTRLIARLTDAGTAEVWNIDNGTQLASIPLPPANGVRPRDLDTVLLGNPVGQELVSVSSNGYLAHWQVSPEAWIQTACLRAGRNMTAAEWTRQTNTAPPANLACR